MTGRSRGATALALVVNRDGTLISTDTLAESVVRMVRNAAHPLAQSRRAGRQRGRRILLATAAHQHIADGVRAHLQLFDAVPVRASRCY